MRSSGPRFVRRRRPHPGRGRARLGRRRAGGACFACPACGEVFAIDAFDPFSRAPVLSRGIVGDLEWPARCRLPHLQAALQPRDRRMPRRRSDVRAHVPDESRWLVASKSRAALVRTTRWGRGSFRMAEDCQSTPEGTLMLFGRRKKNPIRIADKGVAEWKYATCGYCSVGCSIEVGVDASGTPVTTRGVGGADVNRGKLCIKGLTQAQIFAAPGRGSSPKVRRSHLRRIGSRSDWDSALDRVAAEFQRIQAAARPRLRRRHLHRPDHDRGVLHLGQAGARRHRHQQLRRQYHPLHGLGSGRLQALLRCRRPARLLRRLRPHRVPACLRLEPAGAASHHLLAPQGGVGEALVPGDRGRSARNHVRPVRGHPPPHHAGHGPRAAEQPVPRHPGRRALRTRPTFVLTPRALREPRRHGWSNTTPLPRRASAASTRTPSAPWPGSTARLAPRWPSGRWASTSPPTAPMACAPSTT